MAQKDNIVIKPKALPIEVRDNVRVSSTRNIDNIRVSKPSVISEQPTDYIEQPTPTMNVDSDAVDFDKLSVELRKAILEKREEAERKRIDDYIKSIGIKDNRAEIDKWAKYVPADEREARIWAQVGFRFPKRGQEFEVDDLDAPWSYDSAFIPKKYFPTKEAAENIS